MTAASDEAAGAALRGAGSLAASACLRPRSANASRVVAEPFSWAEFGRELGIAPGGAVNMAWLVVDRHTASGLADKPAFRFLAKERLDHREAAGLLSCNDLIEIMRHTLPSKINSDEDLVAMTDDRHRRRRMAMVHAHQQQTLMLNRSACGEI